ncbi:hypothetical protein [Trinickia soli]|uniref:Uncharacterized protein n=1 Tax=Trinickia soli TaxID=380675 RepID=A0A2N7VQ39_9BURK|nr:hypothetical protein [Trinickia soli]PMS19263.1 hypothetical protein C0Z19_21775 [Trinickia soli]CAB3644111.1 hypothetical protein LMG24076_00458 [Trinickia soli]
MSTLFSKPSTPSLPPPPVAPPPPTVDQASVQAENDADALRRRRGMASTILAGANGSSATQPVTSAARLLGN